MKKLFLFLLGISFLTSCSSDSETVDYQDSSANSVNFTLKNGSIDPVLKDLYLKTINSQSYIDFEIAAKSFNEKLGDQIPATELTSSTTILRWISNNLTQTGFSTLIEAQDDLDSLNALSSASIAANYSFHEYLGGTTSGAFQLVLEEQQPVVPTNCPTCRTRFNSCSSAADSAYATTVSAAAGKLRAGEMNSAGYSDACLAAYLTWSSASQACMRTFNVCCIGG